MEQKKVIKRQEYHHPLLTFHVELFAIFILKKRNTSKQEPDVVSTVIASDQFSISQENPI